MEAFSAIATRPLALPLQHDPKQRQRHDRVLRQATSADDSAGYEVVDAVVMELNSTKDGDNTTGPPPPLSEAAEYRAALLQLVGGLDRGSKATQADAEEVQRLATGLADEAEKAGRWKPTFPEDLPDLEGRWRLLYSSAFAGRSLGGVKSPSTPSLGGLRPGPPLTSPLLEVGDIFQQYRTSESLADTIVQLRPPRWLSDTGFLDQIPLLQDDSSTVLTLTQGYSVAAPDALRFAFVDGAATNKVLEVLKQPLRFWFAPPGMPVDTTQDNPFTDTLITTYCDGSVRIGVGGRFGELRIFQRE